MSTTTLIIILLFVAFLWLLLLIMVIRRRHPNQRGSSTEENNKEKLCLEIENLRKKNRWEPFGQLSPMLSVILAALVFVAGIIQFRADRQKDRDGRVVDQSSRFQSQIRSDIDRVLQFPRDEKESVAEVSFLLDDLKALLNSPVGEKKVSEVFPDIEQAVSASLVTLILQDCNFNERPRDVGFATEVIERWSDYSVYLRKDLERRMDLVLYKYVRAIRYLQDQNPGYLTGITYDPQTDGFGVAPEFEKQRNEETRYQHFFRIAVGFMKHIDALGPDSGAGLGHDIRIKNLQQFQDALCNRVVSEKVLEVYFEGRPCEEYPTGSANRRRGGF
jgi:hypothetical protein